MVIIQRKSWRSLYHEVLRYKSHLHVHSDIANVLSDSKWSSLTTATTLCLTEMSRIQL